MISSEEAARRPLPGAAVPRQFAYSHDGRRLAYLYGVDGTQLQSLLIVDVADGASPVEAVPGARGWRTDADLPRSLQLSRERDGSDGLGVVTFSWATAADRLLVPLPDGLHILDSSGRPARRLDVDVEDVVDPKLNPNATRCAFVTGDDLWVIDLADPSGCSRKLTSTGGSGRRSGVAEFIAQSDLGRSSGYWWSPSGTHIAYACVDERGVGEHAIDSEGLQRYPRAGTCNAAVAVGVVHADGGRTTWIDMGTEDYYLARVEWTEDHYLALQLLSRDQRTLELRRADARTGKAQVVHVERSDLWVHAHDDFRPLGGEGAFLWSSERTGHRHLEVRASDGSLLHTLTSGEWSVDRVVAVDLWRGQVYFSGTLDAAIQCHLYAVHTEGGRPVARVSQGPGWHAAVMSNDASTWVDQHSALRRPPTTVVRRTISGDAQLELAADPTGAEWADAAPELVEIRARDGTLLHGLVYRPATVPAPGVVRVYGGPLAQEVADRWLPTVDLRAQELRRRGYCVIAFDNRGSARRGLEFEASLRGGLGEREVSDQVDGVEWAAREGLVDLSRMAIYGWSYGGYMALRCLVAAPEVFRAAVAGAPVTDWELYESHYTERYLGLPQDNSFAYVASSVLPRASEITGRLLIVHGLIDDNVHFAHSARLIQSLIDARIDHEVLVLPRERHHLRGEASRRVVELRVLRFLDSALGGASVREADAGTT